MKLIKPLFSLLILVGLIFLGSNSLKLGSNTLPPIGKFFNPQSGFWVNARSASDENSINTELALKEEVTVKYDDRLVPHIFAENSHDLYYTQGYLTAKHRLWQMDLTARSTAGRLSEVLGERTLPIDKESRQMGLAFAAENALNGWSSDEAANANLRAYIAGVNKYIDDLSPDEYPLEFKLLDYAPEEWTMLHSALVMKAMARTLAGRAGDSRSSNTKAFLGDDIFKELFPEYNPKQSPIIPADTQWDYIEKKEILGVPSAPTLSIGYNDYSPEDRHEILMGSNNWAVDASKTKDGSTMLAGDPHLSLTLPSIWFEAQLHAPDHNTYGVSIAGMHGIVIGFNEHIAWSETNVGHDVIDWYEMKWADASKTKYKLNGDNQDVTYRIEKYGVKGGPEIVDTVKYAVWGPIMEAQSNLSSDVDLAMRWLAHDRQPISEITSFERLNRATNFDQYRDAISTYVAPAQNFAFASKEGDIGITIAGKLPYRDDQQGRFVQAGDDIRNDWKDMIPFEHNPFIKNPERGYVSSANQHSTAPDYPYYYSGGLYFEDYRGRRANDLLEGLDDITIEDMKNMHNDSYSIKAEEVVPILLSSMAGKASSPEDQLLIDILAKWDFKYTATSKGPVVFDSWYRSLYELVWDEFSDNILPVNKPETWKTIELMETDKNNQWFDIKNTNGVETLDDLIVSSFDSLKVKMADINFNTEGTDWSSQRNTRIMHLGRIPAFSRTDIKTDGSRNTLNAVSPTTGPSWRMIVKFKEGVEAYGVYPGGQSGNPGSPMYDNMVDTWSKGEYYKLDFLKDKEDTPSTITNTIILK